MILVDYSFKGSGIAPSPRAAHGSGAVDSLQMVVYGGATGGKIVLSVTFFYTRRKLGI